MADILYYSDPEGTEKKTKKLEAQQLAIAQAAAAKQAAQEAMSAKKQIDQLKKNEYQIK